MSDLPLFETLDSVEINCLKEKLVTQQKRIAELERELEHSKCDSLSQDAMESLEAMVHYCLNNEIAMGMDGGYEKDGSKKAFRKEIEDAFNY